MPQQFGVPEDIINKVSHGELPSHAYSPYLSAIHGKHVIGVNNAYRLGHWIDVVFFGDCGWYLVHQRELAKFPGLKVTCCPRFANRPPDQMEGIKYLSKDNETPLGITTNPKYVSWNYNSGYAAISLAAHFGVKRIYLLGFDMCLDVRGVSHWHGSHHPGRKVPPTPPFPRHMRGSKFIVQHAAERGIQIFNVSPNSAIREFKKVTLDVVLGKVQ